MPAVVEDGGLRDRGAVFGVEADGLLTGATASRVSWDLNSRYDGGTSPEFIVPSSERCDGIEAFRRASVPFDR